MAYYLVAMEDIPYMHGMGERGEDSHCPLALNNLRSEFNRWSWDPDQDTYRMLCEHPSFAERIRRCGVHRGDWSVVIPAVRDLLAGLPSTATADEIADIAWENNDWLAMAPADLSLARALVHERDHLRIYPTPGGPFLSNGQHRICSARAAGAPALPVWFDPTSGQPPMTAKSLQRAAPQ